MRHFLLRTLPFLCAAQSVSCIPVSLFMSAVGKAASGGSTMVSSHFGPWGLLGLHTSVHGRIYSGSGRWLSDPPAGQYHFNTHVSWRTWEKDWCVNCIWRNDAQNRVYASRRCTIRNGRRGRAICPQHDQLPEFGHTGHDQGPTTNGDSGEALKQMCANGVRGLLT